MQKTNNLTSNATFGRRQVDDKTMAMKIIAILLVVSAAIASKKSESRVFPDGSREYDANIGWLFSAAEKNEKGEGKREYNVCQTDACKILGKELKSSMNTSVDPCDNFFDYVCGAWNNRIDLIPAYEDSWGRTQLFQHTVYKRIKYILESEPEPSDILPVRQAKKWYGCCMDQDEREKRGIQPIESILMRTGGWPIAMDLAEWSEDDFSWQDVERNYFHITGGFTFYEIGPYWTWRNGEDAIYISIDTQSMPLDGIIPYAFRRDAEDEDWESYKSFLKRVAEVFIRHNRAVVSDETMDRDLDSLAEFEKKLYKIMNDVEFGAEKTIDEFLADYRRNVTNIPEEFHIDFERLLKILFDIGNIDPDADPPLWIEVPRYYVRLTKLFSETPKRTIANYMHWKFVSRTMLYTTEEMQTIWNEEIGDDVGIEETTPRWLQCVQDLRLQHAASYAFATKYFTKSTEETVLEMIENIRQQLNSQIENSNWLSSKDQDELKDKLNSMKLFIGFPDWYKNETAVKATYKGLKVGYDYFENILNFDKYKIREKLRLMEDNSQEGPWDMEPIIVNAMYAPETNVINIPAADFQPPLFTPDLPDNLNYGIIGCVIGHEIGHGFDDSGIKLNKKGDEAELTNQMIENYYKRAECFLHQFNNYWGVTEPVYEGTTPGYGRGSIGRLTRGENIADTTGLYSVFKAWKKLKAERGREDDRLPGLEEFTDEQMFFIGFASPQCSMYRPEYLQKLKKDVHSVPNIRVNGAVSNSKAFARVFNCPKGSPMNPDDKCNIWKPTEETNEVPSRRRSHRRHHHHRSRWALSGW